MAGGGLVPRFFLLFRVCCGTINACIKKKMPPFCGMRREPYGETENSFKQTH